MKRTGIGWYVKTTGRAIKDTLKGQLLMTITTMVWSMLLFWMLGVRFPIVLGIISGILELIPIFGSMTMTVILLIVTLVDGQRGIIQSSLPLDTAAVIGIYLIVRQAADMLLSPLILGRTVSLHPFLIATATLIGGSLFGIIGMIVAVPIAVILYRLSMEPVSHSEKNNTIE
jgi:predicted PurR-regulated permease PerM